MKASDVGSEAGSSLGGGPAFAALFSRRLDVLVDIHFARAAGRHARDSPVARWDALELERDLLGSRERRADDWAVAAPKTRWQWQSHAANLQGRHEQRDAEKSFEGVPGGGNNCFKKTKEFSSILRL